MRNSILNLKVNEKENLYKFNNLKIQISVHPENNSNLKINKHGEYLQQI